MTSWLWTDILEENDHLIATKQVCFCQKDAVKAALLLNDWANSLTDELDTLSYQQALERAKALLVAVESVLVAKGLYQLLPDGPDRGYLFNDPNEFGPDEGPDDGGPTDAPATPRTPATQLPKPVPTPTPTLAA